MTNFSDDIGHILCSLDASPHARKAQRKLLLDMHKGYAIRLTLRKSTPAGLAMGRIPQAPRANRARHTQNAQATSSGSDSGPGGDGDPEPEPETLRRKPRTKNLVYNALKNTDLCAPDPRDSGMSEAEIEAGRKRSKEISRDAAIFLQEHDHQKNRRTEVAA